MNRRVRKRASTYNGTTWVEDSDLLFVYDQWSVVLVLDANDSNATERKYSSLLAQGINVQPLSTRVRKFCGKVPRDDRAR